MLMACPVCSDACGCRGVLPGSTLSGGTCPVPALVHASLSDATTGAPVWAGVTVAGMTGADDTQPSLLCVTSARCRVVVVANPGAPNWHGDDVVRLVGARVVSASGEGLAEAAAAGSVTVVLRQLGPCDHRGGLLPFLANWISLRGSACRPTAPP